MIITCALNVWSARTMGLIGRINHNKYCGPVDNIIIIADKINIKGDTHALLFRSLELFFFSSLLKLTVG